MTGLARAAEAELARRELERRKCRLHPGLFLRHVWMPDERTAERFEFKFAPEQVEVWERGERRLIRGDERGLWLEDQLLTPAYYKAKGLSGWEWQGDLLDFWELNHATLDLKARQIGVTWLRAGRGLWKALYRPGSNFLVYRQKEDDAVKIIRRVWAMLNSVPEWLWNGAQVQTPAPKHEPSTLIALRFPGGGKSSVQGMASAAAAGHGETAAEAMADEFAHVQAELAPKIVKAAGPAVGQTGDFGVVSTANGRSDEEGNGNYFHYLWGNALEMGFARVFHPWWMHPDRDEDWYDNDPEVRRLRWFEREEQYPANADQAFALSNQAFFDRDAMAWYSENAMRRPLYRCDFKKLGPDRAKILKSSEGRIAVLEEPRIVYGCPSCRYTTEGTGRCPACDLVLQEKDVEYAIGADVATGRGKDYSAAYVVDLTTMALAAEYHGKISADLFAYQLHYLGRWYHTARIAVEMGGGYGEPVIINLRDGKDGRPAYPRLYRYREDDRADTPTRQSYGFPMSQKSRSQVINALEAAVRDHSLPWVTSGLMFEMGNFVNHDNRPTPRAAEGMNDDRIFACAISLEMYRRYGYHANVRKRRPRKPRPHWLPLGG